MSLGYVLFAFICLLQMASSVRQLKKYNRGMFAGSGKYYLFALSNCLNIISIGIIAYGVFADRRFILPGSTLWLFNWHLFTYYAAELKKDTSQTLISIIRWLTGILVLVCLGLLAYGFK